MIIPVERALGDLRNGKFVIILDDPGRENEGDLAIAAEKVTVESILFMLKAAAGFMCLALPGWRLDQLEVPLVPARYSLGDTPFCESVDWQNGSSGSSARDRAMTIQALLDSDMKPEDFCRPGHVIPLRAQADGLLARTGHTEAIVDLCAMAGLYPGGALCEVVAANGDMARGVDLEAFATLYGIGIVSIDEVLAYRREQFDGRPLDAFAKTAKVWKKEVR